MRAALPLLILACLAASAPAAEATKPSAPKSTEATPPPPPEKHTRFRPLMVPVYLVIGLPRDIIDAPVKGISAIPIVNRVLIAPLYLVNMLTTYVCWSGTKDGVGGGFDAWFHCLGMPRKKGAHIPKSLLNRTWRQNYLPNWRTFGFVVSEPVPAPKPAPKPEKPKPE